MHTHLRSLLMTVALSVSMTLPTLAAPSPGPVATVQTRPTSSVQSSMADLQNQAQQDEKQGRWLGAVTAWREYARLALTQDARGLQLATEKLHSLAGLSWMASVKSRESLPLKVGKDLIAMSYRVTNGNGTRAMVSGIDRRSGRLMWTREDAVALSYQGDVVVFVQNWEHLARVNLQNGTNMWEVNLHGGGKNWSHQVLGIHDDMVIFQGDNLPAAVEMSSGRMLWGTQQAARRGYRAMLTARGVLVWPGDTRPAGMSEDDWWQASVVLLSYKDGIAMWTRPILAGEPWRFASDANRLYASDQRLQAESPWTAISLENGQTLWKQRQPDARPSSISPAANVLIEYGEGAVAQTVRFLDPATGRSVWQSDRMVSIFPNGPVIERSPEGPIVARDLDTGKVWWTVTESDELHVDPTGTLLGQSLYMPAHGPGVLSGTDTPGALAADRRDGRIQWRQRATDVPYAQEWRTLATAGDQLLMECSMQIPRAKLTEAPSSNLVTSILALDSNKGSVAWGFWDLAPVRSAPPVRAGNTVFVVGADKDGSTLYAFDLDKITDLVKTGKRWWW